MRVLTVGGAMVDTIAIIDSSMIERMSMSNADSSFLLLEQGKKTEALRVSTHCGGGAVNAAVGMARQGHSVATLVKLGTDDRARLIVDRLEEEGVATKFVVRDEKAPSGASVIISSHDRNAAIFTFRGANSLLTVAELKDEAFRHDVVYVSTLSDKSADCMPTVVDLAKRNGAFVAINPGVRQLSTRFGAIRASLADIDLIAVNRLEARTLFAQALTELAASENRSVRALAAHALPGPPVHTGATGPASGVAIMAGLRSLGARRALLTDGKVGAYALAGDEVTFCPSLKTEVVGTAGAGDAFVSTFAVRIAGGTPVEEALRAAAINAASVVGFADTQSGLLDSASIDQRLAQNSRQLAVQQWRL